MEIRTIRYWRARQRRRAELSQLEQRWLIRPHRLRDIPALPMAAVALTAPVAVLLPMAALPAWVWLAFALRGRYGVEPVIKNFMPLTAAPALWVPEGPPPPVRPPSAQRVSERPERAAPIQPRAPSLLTEPAMPADPPVFWLLWSRCNVCNRELFDYESMIEGIGPTCQQRTNLTWRREAVTPEDQLAHDRALAHWHQQKQEIAERNRRQQHDHREALKQWQEAMDVAEQEYQRDLRVWTSRWREVDAKHERDVCAWTEQERQRQAPYRAAHVQALARWNQDRESRAKWTADLEAERESVASSAVGRSVQRHKKAWGLVAWLGVALLLLSVFTTQRF